MFNRVAYENTQPGGIGVLEVANGSQPGEEHPKQFVPLKRTELRGEVTGPLASLRLTQTYGYSRQQSDKVLEALYRFPLPGDAAVTGVRVRFGDVEIRAELKERQQAQADYDEAKRQGRQAALATRESPDVFTLHIAGIQPDQEVLVETSYVQLARPEGAGWSLRVPLTTAPRYVRSDELTSRHAQGQPLALLRDPGHRFALDLSLPGAASAESLTHKLDVTRDGDRLRVRLRDGEVLPDRDCVISWQPVQNSERPALKLFLHDDARAGQLYFLALVAPPAVRDPGRAVPREAILLVDHSGSMSGPKWEASDWAVKRFLSELSDRDYFALGFFHNTTRWFANRPEPATPAAVQRAIQFTEASRDSGGTELGVALEQAVSLERVAGEASRHVLIVTDAAVSDAGRILRLADEESRRPERRRISVLCIDAAPNAFLAQELAERGGGVARFLTSAPQEQDITTALDEVLADWSEPILAGLRLEVNRPGAEAAGRQVSEQSGSHSTIDLGDLPAGRSVWVAGRVPRGAGGALEFRVMGARGREIAAERAELDGSAHEAPALKALFGARRVLGLEHLIASGYSGDELRDQLRRLGYDPDRDLAAQPASGKIYAENVREDANKALRGLLVREALDYGLASAETAFIAVRTEAGKPVEGTVAVANALPTGWSEDFLSTGGGIAAQFMAAAAPPPPSAAGFTGGGGRGLVARAVSSFLSSAAPSAPLSESAPSGFGGKETRVFAGIPQIRDGEAVLFDSAASPESKDLPSDGTIQRLAVRLPGDARAAGKLDAGLTLLIFVDDLAAPRARVRLVDLIRQGGTRPLNLLRRAGQLVRVVLVDPAGAWAAEAPTIEVTLGWSAGG